MTTLSLRTLVRNAAAVFSGCYGAVSRQAEQAGCSRQTVYEHARQIERRCEPPAPAAIPTPAPAPAPVLDEPARRRLAVTAFAMGLSTRQIEDQGQFTLLQKVTIFIENIRLKPKRTSPKFCLRKTF